MHRIVIGMDKRHEKLVRIGPNEISVSDYSTVKQIYGASSEFRKSAWYSVWQGHEMKLCKACNVDFVSGIYSMEYLKSFEADIGDAVSLSFWSVPFPAFCTSLPW